MLWVMGGGFLTRSWSTIRFRAGACVQVVSAMTSASVRTAARPTVLLAVTLAVITVRAAARQRRALTEVFSSTRLGM